jgi:hypothetical protein
MSAISITIAFIVLIVSICLVFIALNNKGIKERKAPLFKQFAKFAHENNIHFPDPELLRDSVFGIDVFKQQLLILTRMADASYTPVVIALHELKGCYKKKTYLQLEAEGSRKSRPEKHLEKISLLLEFNSTRPPVELTFYEYRYDSLMEMPDLEQKASYWEQLLLKLDISSRGHLK